ncbi:unnamed protein product [Musa hybrid cultivar]
MNRMPPRSLSLSQSDDISRKPGQVPPVVAVDKDKNSQQAMKWAVDHLLINTNSIILVHVRTQPDLLNSGLSVTEANQEMSKEQVEAELTQLFVPYRGFCARKGLQLTEVILEDFDVSKAIIDYITSNNIQNVVVGASSRNALRKFMNPDVPTCLTKGAPEFCGVYVIYKGKPLTIRTAKVPAPVNTFPPKQQMALDSPYRQAEHFDHSIRSATENAVITKYRNSERPPDYMRGNKPLPTPRMTSNDAYIDILDSSVRSSRTNYHDSYTGNIDFPASTSFRSDLSDAFELGYTESPRGFLPPAISSMREAEAEMRRLRLELKQTAEMYNAACKEAIMAKEKARELQKLKIEEARRIEELRQSEEAALVLVELEKAKCKAAMEAAEAAQKIAELEARRRYNAELKARREAKERKKATESVLRSEIHYRKYSIDEIEVATNFFSSALKVGEGGYGPVFRATLDHTQVAIKVLRPDASQGRKQFQQEVEILSCIRHPNMVLLLGACPEYGCLVYEYMDYGSLEDRLLRRGNTPPIPWATRFKIAAEIATALLFLHQTKPEPLVHRDLKPANILLDHNYVSKISDVGLARLVPASVADSVTQYRITSTAGTLCYIDPEYQQTGMLGVKSDIYSLGIMLLQIITAKPPMSLTHHVERSIEKGNFADMLDPAIEDWPVEETLAFAKLALKCAELRRKDRPDLGKVVLPELSRLRSIGQEYKASRSNNSRHLGAAPKTFDSISKGAMSLIHQEQISDSNVSESWTYSTDG